MGDSEISRDLKPGDIVEGRYRIIKMVGEGGMGDVFLAEHVLIKRRVAIKILHREMATDVDVVERFMNEALAAGTLGHPNIVESTDMGFTRNDIPYIVFEYLEGPLLTEEIYRVHGMPVRRALKIATQIASALHAAHNAGIVHRDLKSDNVILTDRDDASDFVKVLDFGISRFLDGDDGKGGRQNLVMGTPEFMAPEQITTPDAVDRRADVYALGVVLYEMLSARRPFTDPTAVAASRSRIQNLDSAHALLQRIVNEPPPPLGRADTPVGLEEMILDKLLAKDPAQRYQSMKDVQGALEAFTSVLVRSSQSIPPIEKPIERRPQTIPPPATLVELPKPSKRRLGWVIALVGALLAGVAGGVVMYLDQQPPPVPITNLAAIAALQTDGQAIGSTLDAEVRAAHLRAEALATTPMLRAAIETDAATLHDMSRGDLLIRPNPDETLEIYQLRDNAGVSMLRIPETGTPVALLASGQTRAQADGNGLVITVSAPITKQQGGIGGTVMLSTPVDLAALRKRVAEHAVHATLIGLGKPIALASAVDGSGTATATTVPIATTPRLGELSLVATVLPLPAPTVTNHRTASFGLWGLGGGLLLISVVSLLRGRRRS